MDKRNFYGSFADLIHSFGLIDHNLRVSDDQMRLSKTLTFLNRCTENQLALKGSFTADVGDICWCGGNSAVNKGYEVDMHLGPFSCGAHKLVNYWFVFTIKSNSFAFDIIILFLIYLY